MQTVVTPVIAGGNGLTVTVSVLVQPPAPVYIIAAVPAPTPVTSPEDVTVATPLAPLLQVPPGVALVNAVVPPTHITAVPVTGKGFGLMVTTTVAIQPVGMV